MAGQLTAAAVIVRAPTRSTPSPSSDCATVWPATTTTTTILTTTNSGTSKHANSSTNGLKSHRDRGPFYFVDAFDTALIMMTAYGGSFFSTDLLTHCFGRGDQLTNLATEYHVSTLFEN
ncbi:salivary glue protein Sgs-3 [Trichinella spiralis]|uniref:salivary glue protein Sgs-3 n=1 Tax=Trichinella spiralis TaxID=6334 RepID=UPI0001EFD2BD|nr:salivary glue protein Sgs-3 [Trichinella spiralis]